MNNAEDFKTGVIYCYTSPSGKKYVGQTINERARKNKHRSGTKKSKTYFGAAIRKYGFENFEYKVLIKFSPTVDKLKLKRVLNKLEKRYIKLFESDNPDKGYNLNKGGDGNLGYEHLPETIEHIRQTSLDRWANEEFREKSIEAMKVSKQLRPSQIMGPKSEEIKLKLSEMSKNKKLVYQLNDKLEIINTFSSIAEAARTIDSTATHKTKSNRISEVCSGKCKSAYNFIWSFEKL